MIFNNTMFVATGNGGFDPGDDQYGDSVLNLSLPDLAVSRSTWHFLTHARLEHGCGQLAMCLARRLHNAVLSGWSFDRMHQAISTYD